MISNLEQINKIKRKKINNVLHYIDSVNKQTGRDNVKRVIIFGSSITDDCTEDSDIDICLDTEYDCKNRDFFKIYGNIEIIAEDLCDILIYRKLNGDLKREIDKKGVTVYEY